MSGVPFPGRFSGEELGPVREAIERFSEESKFSSSMHIIDLKEIDGNEKRYLRERNIITNEMESSDHSLVVVNHEDDFSILVNEEDHFRIQVIRPGLQLSEAYKIADQVDTELNRFVPYAFSDELGYLTACTSNIGTGLKASMLLHLPVSTMKNRVMEIVQGEKKNIVEIKGTAGNTDKPLGCLYQLSNKVSIGLSEIDIIEMVDEILGRILDTEDAGRDTMFSESRLEMEDKIWRSFAVLSYSRRIGYFEAMEHLSSVRLGIILAVIKNIDLKVINDMMVNIQWAHLQKNCGLLFKSTSESDECRADYLRRILGPFGVR